MIKVERSLLEMLPPLKDQQSQDSTDTVQRRGTGMKALIWITHEAAQADRVGTRTVDITRR